MVRRPILPILLLSVACLAQQNEHLGGTGGAGGIAGYQLQAAVPLQFTIASLPNATEGTTYSQTLTAIGGLSPYAWAISIGNLPPGISLDSATGALTGTPTATGSFSFTVVVHDSSSPIQTASKTFTIGVSCPTLLFTTLPGPLPAGEVSLAYNYTFLASGGLTPLTWSSTGVPAGLSLNTSTGVLSGTPTTAGQSAMTVSVNDSCAPTAQTVTEAFSLQINSAVRITTTSPLPQATAGVAYSTSFAATGGTQPYTWSTTSTLPTGLSLSPLGLLSGTTTQAGTYSITVNVTDAASITNSVTFTLVVVCPTLVISTTSPLPNATQSVAYSNQFTSTGGFGAISWTSGALPAGLALSSGGLLSGTPTAPGTSSLSITATDSCSTPQARIGTFSLTVNNSLTIATANPLPSGVEGVAYSTDFTATEGVTPYTWTVTAGTLPAGLTLSSAGNLAGTPTSAGTFSFTVTVTDSTSTSTSQVFSITITCPAFSITSTSPLPSGTQNSPYSDQLMSAGGILPIRWSASGILPAGISMATSGLLSGTPTGFGNFLFTISAADSCAPTPQTKQGTFSLTITQSLPPLSVTTTTLPGGTVGTAYSASVSASGGTTPYVWTLQSGTLPAGLTLASNGTISGTPTSSGTPSFVVKVTDAVSNTATASLAITILCPALVLASTSPLPTGVVGSAYSFQFQATGGITPYSWSLIGGSLPSGMSLVTSGLLSGTPTVSGSFSPNVQVTDSCAPSHSTQSRVFALTVNPATSTLTITTASPLPTATPGVAYNVTLSAKGGKKPYFWSLISGTLPAGLSLSSAGKITGTPTTSGTSSFTVQVTDSAGHTATKAFSLTVSCTALTITSSATLPSGTSGVGYSDQLASSGGQAPISWALTGGTLPTGVTVSSGGLIAGTPSSTGSFSPAITATDSCSTPQTTSKTFSLTIAAAPPPLAIVTTSPLPSGLQNTAYSTTMAATGGTAPYTWAVTAGSLQTGLSLSSAGVISGTPTVASTVTVTIRVTDNVAATTSETFSLTVNPQSTTAGCGTDTGGTPTDNTLCGASGTNAYTSEGASDLTSWCGGSVPGVCTAISSCSPTLTAGTFSSHTKYYLSADLSCGLTSVAITPARYLDLNLNAHTITGAISWNLGALRGFHLFNGTINCTATYPTACVDIESIDGGFTQGGGDKLAFHHLTPSNTDVTGYVIRVTGVISTTGAWTESAVNAFNDTFQSQPETTSARQHAGIYSETHPAEYFNNLGNVGNTGQANATQLLEVYAKSIWNLSTVDFIHNNHLTCNEFNITGGDSCRPILCDGATCHVQYNDIAATNNRSLRLRDSKNSEVDHNYFHNIYSANGTAGAGIHSGDNDINSGLGINLAQNIHSNTFELGVSGLGLLALGQQGITYETNNFLCASVGCANAFLVNLQNQNRVFGYPVAVDAVGKTITQPSGDFTLGPAITIGSVVTFAGFTNAGNNKTYTVTAVTPTVITLSDPSNQLVTESSNTATYAGVTSASLFNSFFAVGLPLQVQLLQATPTVNLNYCPSPPVVTVAGNGSLNLVAGTCP